MPRLLDARLIADVAAQVGEGPQWDAAAGVLTWVDVTAGLVHRSDASGEVLWTHVMGRPVGAALPSASGGLLIADADGFTTLFFDRTASVLLPFLTDNPQVYFNDAKCDPKGRAWAGTVAYDETPGAGTLYRLDPGPVATPVLPGRTVSNGLGWSPDARTMWFADSADPHICAFAYDVTTGTMGPLRTVVGIQATAGVPDGLCVDDDGCVWVGLWGGHAVHRYTPDGRLDTVVRVPVERVTSCAFGGADQSTLFITTARLGMTAQELRREPSAGGLFAVRPGSTGPAAVPWSLDV